MFTSLTRDPGTQYLMLDITLIRAHQQAAGNGPNSGLRGVCEEIDNQDPCSRRYLARYACELITDTGAEALSPSKASRKIPRMMPPPIVSTVVPSYPL
jgi:hypothetical protein